MKLARFFLTGIFFGIVLTKAEAVSWYRIYEMFHFQSFHMYGIIGTALFTGVIGLQLIKRYKIKDKSTCVPELKIHYLTERLLFKNLIAENETEIFDEKNQLIIGGSALIQHPLI